MSKQAQKQSRTDEQRQTQQLIDALLREYSIFDAFRGLNWWLGTHSGEWWECVDAVRVIVRNELVWR